ncbi:MAG TPA: PDZ domain-containing protein [Phycisphaerales bacterium]|nr:PDZ domain-containing protein [Phycisphaerales bacterium]HMP38203.1 PDZ domain-containing protein [Phycisphaerales bacterium]
MLGPLLRLFVAVALAVAGLAAEAPGQGSRGGTGSGLRDGSQRDDRTASQGVRRADRLPTEEEIVAAFGRKAYSDALAMIDRVLAADPDDALMRYNGACACALLGRLDEAAARLEEAVRRGFRDFQHMERDPDLAALRDHPAYQRLLAGRQRSDREAGRREFEAWKTRFGAEAYRYESDEELNLHFATALDARMHERMRRMLRIQAKEQVALLFEGPPRESVFVAIPTRADADEFFRDLGRRDATFNTPNVAGIYEHRPRRLISTDIGQSLRHEFTHAMHYGDMERLGQAHPLWIQEGLATLFEDYEFDPEDRIRFVDNERDAVIRELVRSNRAMPWRTLFAIEAQEFMSRAQSLYPQVRSIFRYVHAEGKLTEWYRAYTRGFGDDRTSKAAFEEVFGLPLAEIERAWRGWVLDEPIARRVVVPGSASLGVAVDDVPDGARVVRVLAGSAAEKSDIRRDDVIISVDGVSTSSATELVAVVARRAVGAEVEVVLRRGREYFRIKAILQPLPRSPS